MASKNSETAKKMAKLLEEGWALTSIACPVSKTPLLRNKQGQRFCADCNATVVSESEYKYDGVTPASMSAGGGASESKSDFAISTKPPTASVPKAADPIIDDRPPPKPRGGRAEDAVSSLIGEKLVAGWAMLESTCPTCSIPLMAAPNSSDAVCIRCIPAATKPQPKKGKDEDASSLIGQKLLLGWRMLAQSCVTCNCPLMTPKGTSDKICVLCGKVDGEAAPRKKPEESIVEQKAELKPLRPESASFSQHHETATIPSSRKDANEDWGAALAEVHNNIRVDEVGGPKARSTLYEMQQANAAPVKNALPRAAATVMETPIGPETTSDRISGVPLAQVAKAEQWAPAGRVQVLSSFSIPEPTAEEIERVARGLRMADADAGADIPTSSSLPTQSILPAVQKSVSLGAATPTTQSTPQGVVSSPEAALQGLYASLEVLNQRIASNSRNFASDQVAYSTVLQAASDLPKITAAIQALRSLSSN